VPIDIRQLRYAIAAADHGSFYRAARVLEIEQSTLSRAILKLERSIGMPIFQRSRAGVTMTLAGNAFIRGAKPMVATACQRRTKLSLFCRCRCPSFIELFISRARHDCWLRREATRCFRRTISLNHGRARRYSPEPVD
jgi:Bacterial regulatory helix-turn-helix protein, lysR family